MMKHFLIASLLVSLAACSTTAKRVPGSLKTSDGEPQKGETFEQIQGIAKRAFNADFKNIFLKDLIAHPTGKSKKIADWIEEGYHATLLGGYAARDEATTEFDKAIDPGYQEYIKQKEHKDDTWSAYCSNFPELCNRAMIDTCKKLQANPEANSDWFRLKQALLNSGFSERQIKSALKVKDECNTSEPWWAGKCHITPVAQGLFPDPPKNITVGDQKLEKSELSLAAYLLAEKQSNPDMLVRPSRGDVARDRNINPASLLMILMNTYGFYPGEFIYVIDRDASDAVWNYLVKSYELKFGDELKRDQVDDIYSKLEKGVRYLPHVAAEAVKFKKVTLSLSLAEYDTPFNYGMILEFDDQDQLIGGEWLEPQHPDFIWSVPADNKSDPVNPVEKQLYDWLTK